MHLWRPKGYLSLIFAALLAALAVAGLGAPASAESLRTVNLPGPGFYQRGPHG